VLEVRDVAKAFDGFQAVAGVSLEVPRGQIAAIIGPNGAGKTTLFNLITGHLRPDAGAGQEQAPPQSADLVNREKICTAMMLAPRPTPQIASDGVPFPAAMPATWVPCQQPSSEQSAAAPGPTCSSVPFGQSEVLRRRTVVE